ncbi:uncharacterized protein LOC121382273 [Gigantopelta aegis]|uniref:uncharacterized protein LOC121382273 n=1 Tax=Gigantopelta aegis TaxID=1735272 RepID=UPI001B888395|nr:uncharacterized protein LOC121382273 [Gigantopelta aegis]XP_041367775.1 uncharacterized protein LOC121382273 [Gigantopelta aegis]
MATQKSPIAKSPTGKQTDAKASKGAKVKTGAKITDETDEVQKARADALKLADDLTPDESFLAVSPEEHESWEKMMETRKNEIAQRQEEFEKWLDNMTKRRMFAYSKLKKIEKISRERTQYYEEMRKHLHKAMSSHTVTSKS